jgi:glyoxylase-like metal-dependent hydrolase (beta-lactamase superfamily II)
MLATMAHAVPQAAKIDTLVNTHVNGDHTHGNQLVIGAEIVGTRQLREEMEAFPPEQLTALFQNWRALGAAGEFLNETMGSRFDFDGVVNTPPTRLFDGELTLKVGDKEVRLVDLGPAHTPSDTVAYVPQDRTLFTGDLLFHGGHPAVSAGPVRNWIAACDRMLGWDVETVVPGHGPITDKNAARAEGLFRDADRRGTQALRCRAVGRGVWCFLRLFQLVAAVWLGSRFGADSHSSERWLSSTTAVIVRAQRFPRGPFRRSALASGGRHAR